MDSPVKERLMPQLPRWIGRIELDIESAGSEPFQRLDGIAMMPNNSAWFVDRGAAVAYLVSTHGALVTSVGQRGDGPGDFRDPCCPAIDEHGRLWVVDGNLLSVFLVNDTDIRLESKIAVRVGRSIVKRKTPVILQNGNRVVVEVGRRDRSGDVRQNETSVLELDTRGTVIREWPYPFRSADWFGIAVYEIPRRPAGRFMTREIPFAGRLILTRSSNGSYALVRSREYDVYLHELSGTLVSRIQREDRVGPLLTSTEQRYAEDMVSRWAAQAERVGGIVPEIEIPQRKPAIDDLWFDADRRIWVAVSRPGRSQWSEADVYSPDGSLAFRAVWPGDVDLSDGAISGEMAWGKRRGELDEERIVFLQFQHDPAGS